MRRLHVRLLSCQRHTFTVDQDDVVSDFQRLVELQCHIPLDLQIIIRPGKTEETTLRGKVDTLVRDTLEDNDEILVVEKLPDMPPVPELADVKAMLQALGHEVCASSCSGGKSRHPRRSGVTQPPPKGTRRCKPAPLPAMPSCPVPSLVKASSQPAVAVPQPGEHKLRPLQVGANGALPFSSLAVDSRSQQRPASPAILRSSAPQIEGARGTSAPPVPLQPRREDGVSSSSSLSALHGSSSSSSGLHEPSVIYRGKSGEIIRRVRRHELESMGRLGAGAFGVVTLEKDCKTGCAYAMKAVSKGHLVSLKMENSVVNEKHILQMVDSPFIIQLYATYSGRQHVYFLLEAALGGELFTTYERLRLYGSEIHARFYVGCVTEALDYLHQRSVLYRDLKPENLLLDARGYCKLTDMGLAKVAHSLTFTVVGTPEYMAPEVVRQLGHERPVDWWMVGILLYELLVGRSPFEGRDNEDTYHRIQAGIDIVQFPVECRGPARELVKQLCHAVPEFRLRASHVQQHAWFSTVGFNWNELRALQMKTPLQPRVAHPFDLSNFRKSNDESTDAPRTPTYVDTGSGWDKGFEDQCIGIKRAERDSRNRVASRERCMQPGYPGGLGGS